MSSSYTAPTTRQVHEQGDIVLLLAGCLFAPFTLLTCLALFRLAGCRVDNADSKESSTNPDDRRRQRSWQRQAVLLTWLAAAAGLAGIAIGFGVLRDWHFEAGPGDQLVMRLGSWAGLCDAVSLDISEKTKLGEDLSQPTTCPVELFTPGLVINNWPTQPINRSIIGRIDTQTVAAKQSVDISWELPVPGAVSTLTVTTKFRYRLRLLMRRIKWLHQEIEPMAVDAGSTRLPKETMGFGEVLLEDAVHGINSETVHNVSHRGRLTMQLTCLEDSIGTLDLIGREGYAYSVRFTSHHYTTETSKQRLVCRLGQQPCVIDNPSDRMVLLLTNEVEPLILSSTKLKQQGKCQIVLRCNRRFNLAALAPALLVSLVCMPSVLLLIADALLAVKQVPRCCSWGQGGLTLCHSATDKVSGETAVVPHIDRKSGRVGQTRLGVRFQLD